MILAGLLGFTGRSKTYGSRRHGFGVTSRAAATIISQDLIDQPMLRYLRIAVSVVSGIC
jgi:hypothetical protein